MIPPNQLDKDKFGSSSDSEDGKGKRPGSEKKNKTVALR